MAKKTKSGKQKPYTITSNRDFVFDTYKQISSCSQKTLLKVVTNFLTHHYGAGSVVATKEYVYCQGTAPVCLVAHLDTVHYRLPTDFYYDPDKGALWSPDGLGADDRAGVFGIVEVVKSGLRPSVIFTTDEEIGGIGASAIVYDFIECPLTDIKFFVELDRRGFDDCVFYQCDNKKFSKFIQGFGFKEQVGSFSDISILCSSWGIAGVNLSIGYENEHSLAEILYVYDYLETIERVGQIIEASMSNNVAMFEYVPATPPPRSHTTSVCEICGQKTNYQIPAMSYGDTPPFHACHECLGDFPI